MIKGEKLSSLCVSPSPELHHRSQSIAPRSARTQFDASSLRKGAGRKTDMMLMDFNLSQATRKAFARDGGVYELVEHASMQRSPGPCSRDIETTCRGTRSSR
jgi:hypothetical protein